MLPDVMLRTSAHGLNNIDSPQVAFKASLTRNVAGLELQVVSAVMTTTFIHSKRHVKI